MKIQGFVRENACSFSLSCPQAARELNSNSTIALRNLSKELKPIKKKTEQKSTQSFLPSQRWSPPDCTNQCTGSTVIEAMKTSSGQLVIMKGPCFCLVVEDTSDFEPVASTDSRIDNFVPGFSLLPVLSRSRRRKEERPRELGFRVRWKIPTSVASPVSINEITGRYLQILEASTLVSQRGKLQRKLQRFQLQFR